MASCFPEFLEWQFLRFLKFPFYGEFVVSWSLQIDVCLLDFGCFGVSGRDSILHDELCSQPDCGSLEAAC